MHHNHHHNESAGSKLDQDERSVTRWLNTMEASLARPDHKFSMSEFSPKDIKAINSYMATHEKSLGRYEEFLPPVKINMGHEHSHLPGHKNEMAQDKNAKASEKSNMPLDRSKLTTEKSNMPLDRSKMNADKSNVAVERNIAPIEKNDMPPAKVSNVDQDERAVTRWLNTMEASLARPDNKFSMSKFSNPEIKAINAYIATHEKSLSRYEQFLPPAEVKKVNSNHFVPNERPHWV